MDFPLFHLAFFGDRLLIAVVAIIHVLVNHALAVGGIPLVLALEWWAHRRGDAAVDDLARRMMGVILIATTTVGALTGVGIWFATALINPEAIGSLLRIFFWAWFAEWLVFITEVGLLLAYALTWKTWSGPRKVAHLRLGAALAAFSWITMAIIVAILGFMLTSGTWSDPASGPDGDGRTLWAALFNPTYLPQLALRTPLAMVMAGCAGLLLACCFTAAGSERRRRVLRFIGMWTLAWIPLTVAGLAWYMVRVPPDFAANLPVALGTQAGARHIGAIVAVLVGLGAVIAAVGAMAVWTPRAVGRWVGGIALVASCVLLGAFERAREFMRKPYAIGGYLYANRFRVADYPLLRQDGILAHSTWVEAPAGDPIATGRAVYELACATCHTVDGMNGLTAKLTTLYGTGPWDADSISLYLTTIHDVVPYMPPFPGNDAERQALSAWLASLDRSR